MSHSEVRWRQVFRGRRRGREGEDNGCSYPGCFSPHDVSPQTFQALSLHSHAFPPSPASLALARLPSACAHTLRYKVQADVGPYHAIPSTYQRCTGLHLRLQRCIQEQRPVSADAFVFKDLERRSHLVQKRTVGAEMNRLSRAWYAQPGRQRSGEERGLCVDIELASMRACVAFCLGDKNCKNAWGPDMTGDKDSPAG